MDNNISIVLDVLGAKIAEQKQEFAYSEMRYKMLSEDHNKLLNAHEELKCQYDALVDKLNDFCTGRNE